MQKYFPYLGGRRLRNCGFYVVLLFEGVRNSEFKSRRGNKSNYLIPRIP